MKKCERSPCVAERSMERQKGVELQACTSDRKTQLLAQRWVHLPGCVKDRFLDRSGSAAVVLTATTVSASKKGPDEETHEREASSGKIHQISRHLVLNSIRHLLAYVEVCSNQSLFNLMSGCASASCLSLILQSALVCRECVGHVPVKASLG